MTRTAAWIVMSAAVAACTGNAAGRTSDAPSGARDAPAAVDGPGSAFTCPTAPPIDLTDANVKAQCVKRVYVVGGDNFHVIVSSDDGATWASFAIDDIAGDDYVNDIAVGDGVVTVSGLPGFYTSVDRGATFQLVSTVPNTGFDSYGGQINFGANKFVLTNNDGTFLSSDGLAWASTVPFPDKSQPNGFGQHFHGRAFGGTTYVVEQDNGAYRTYDGTTWTQGVMVGSDFQASGIAYGNGVFVSAGAGSAGQLTVTSTDGKTWTNLTTKDATSTALGTLGDVTFDGATFHAFAGNKVVYTSSDGKTWTKGAQSDSVTTVAFVDGHYLGVDSTQIVTSTDGATWTGVHTFTASETFHINGPRVGAGYVLK